MTEQNSFLVGIENDVLGLVLGLLEGHYWALLWTCGNTALNRRLSSCTSLRKLSWKPQNRRSPPWPRYLHRFPHITDIQLETYISNKSREIKVADMLSLPRKLQKMEIFGESCANLLQEANDLDPSHFIHLEVAIFHYQRLGNYIKPMALSWPQNLVSLRIPHYTPNIKLVLSQLPPNLTELIWHSTTAHINEGDKFPESLQKLTWTLPSALTFNPLDLLPMTMLELTLLGDIPKSMLERERFPKDLKNLVLQDVYLSDLVEYCPDHLERLETHLMYLQPDYPTVEIIKALPRTITSLVDVLAYSVTPDVAAALPCSLTYISEPISLAVLPHMPDSMTSLTIHRISLDAIAPEADSDEEFSEENSDENGSNSDDLEVSVDEIDLNKVSGSNKPKTGTNELLPINWFPSCLKSLHIEVALDTERYVPYLPIGLTKLEAITPIRNSEMAKRLPPGLLDLSFTQKMEENHNEVISALPSSLTKLKLGITRLDSQLPTLLQNLYIQVDSIDDEWFSKLPVSLTQLKMYITDRECLPRLRSDRVWQFPDLLSVIDITMVSGEVLGNPEDIHFFASKILKSLPPMLKAFRLSLPMNLHPKLQNEDMRNMPRFLTRLNLWAPNDMDKGCLKWITCVWDLVLNGSIPEFFGEEKKIKSGRSMGIRE